MSLIKMPHELNCKGIKLKGLLYGVPGAGKTTLALSSPNPVLIDCDNGIHRVQAAHRTPFLPVTSYKEIQDLLGSGELNQFDSIVIDTAGKLLDYMSADIIKNNPKMGKSDGALSLQGYGVRKQMFVNLIKQINIMGKHAVFVAHDKEDKRDDDVVMRPEISGSSCADLMKELDWVAYMEMNGNQRTISFAPCSRYYAKNSARMNDIMVVPALSADTPNNFLTRVFSKVQAAIEEESAETSRYTTLMIELRGDVAAIRDAKTGNKCLKAIREADHIWDSKAKIRAALYEKVKEVGLKFDAKKDKFVGAEPEEEEESESTLTNFDLSMDEEPPHSEKVRKNEAA